MWNMLGSFNRRPGATDLAISRSEKQLGMKLPPEYIEFLRFADGGEGLIGDGAYAILWSVEELASMNQMYKVQEYAPGLLIFGSNGGGEAYGFDTRDPHWPIVQIPFVGMEWQVAYPKGETFPLFLKCLSEEIYD